jgi:ketosteroid isomerase-like protein
MVPESQSIVRSIIAAWERGDFSSAEWAHPRIEFVMADGPEPGAWTGLDGMARAMREILNPWEDARVVFDDYRQLDGERVLVLVRRSGRGKASGLDVDRLIGAKGAILAHIREGMVTRLVFYWERARALADLGLAPEHDAANPPP